LESAATGLAVGTATGMTTAVAGLVAVVVGSLVMGTVAMGLLATGDKETAGAACGETVGHVDRAMLDGTNTGTNVTLEGAPRRGESLGTKAVVDGTDWFPNGSGCTLRSGVRAGVAVGIAGPAGAATAGAWVGDMVATCMGAAVMGKSAMGVPDAALLLATGTSRVALDGAEGAVGTLALTAGAISFTILKCTV
jgi:hypothetical protein